MLGWSNTLTTRDSCGGKSLLTILNPHLIAAKKGCLKKLCSKVIFTRWSGIVMAQSIK
jgi:hypothetical protein